MTRAALLAVLLASAASAQPVSLRPGPIPAGTRICGTGTFDNVLRTTAPDGVQESRGAFTSAVCWDRFEMREGRLVSAREVLTRFAGADDALGDATDPLLGDTLQLARQADDSWTARLLHGRPTQEQTDALSVPYPFELDDLYLPETSVSTGDTWEISASVLTRAAGSVLVSAATPFRYTVRLDSLGQRGGRRVAYLTHDGTFTLMGPGESPVASRKVRVAAVDLETGVETWAVQTLSRSSRFDTSDGRGKPAVVRFKVERRSEIERTIETPAQR